MTQDEHHKSNLFEGINRISRDFRKQLSQGKQPQLELCHLEIEPDGRDAVGQLYDSRTSSARALIPRAEAWLLGDQYDQAVVAPECDLVAWEREFGLLAPTSEFKA